MDATDVNDGDGQKRPTQIPRNSLHAEVVTQVRDMIIRGDVPPGQWVRERELCEELGISRTPLREALKVLAVENMVELLPGRGARVVQPTVEDIQELFEILGVLEGLSGELACMRVTDEEIAEIRELHNAMVRHYEQGERLEYYKLNEQIHETILRCSRNSNLSTVYRMISGRVRHTRYVSSLTGTRWQEAVDEHHAMMQALENRDSERMFQILREHLSNKAAAAKAAIIEEGANLQQGS